MKRFVVLLLVVLVTLPGLMIPAADAACAMPGTTAAKSCSYCEPHPGDAGARFEAGCCRFLPNSESTAAQAGSVVTPPKPHHSPEAAAVLPGVPALGAAPAVMSSTFRVSRDAPPPVSPIRTTHLLF